jgi:hypothetical protein
MVEILRRSRPKVAGDRPNRFFGVTASQRVLATLAAFRDAAATHDRMPHLASWAQDLGKRLESHWPDHPPLPEAAGLV